jgi:hypothetical protein
MKLLYCDVCDDIFNLTGTRVKTCHCGRVKGVYINHSEAITNGKGHSLAIGNGSFMSALYKKIQMKSTGVDYDRKDYLEQCRVEYCWIRPNEGNGNPHQFVRKEDDEDFTEAE